MEPITTTALISGVVGYLTKNLKENKTFTDFTKDFTSATVNWIRPLFLKDDQPKEVLENLQQKPDSEARQKAAEAAIATHIEDNPTARQWLEEMYAEIQQKKQREKSDSKGSILIIDSERVNTGDLSATGDINQSFGDVPK